MASQRFDAKGAIKQELPPDDIMDSHEVEVPKSFICPLTLQIFEDPLLDPSSGHSFSREAIMEWLFRQEFRGRQTNPLTRRPLLPGDLIPNDKLRLQISNWKAQHGIYEEPEQDRISIPIPWYRLHSNNNKNNNKTTTTTNDCDNPNAIGGEAFAQRLLVAQRRDAEFRRKYILGGMMHDDDDDDDDHHHHRGGRGSVASSPRTDLEFGRLFR